MLCCVTATPARKLPHIVAALYVSGQSKWRKHAELCNEDSDGDGKTNGEELGDPCCVWHSAALSTVEADYRISHPGHAEDVTESAGPTASECQALQARVFCALLLLYGLFYVVPKKYTEQIKFVGKLWDFDGRRGCRRVKVALLHLTRRRGWLGYTMMVRTEQTSPSGTHFSILSQTIRPNKSAPTNLMIVLCWGSALMISTIFYLP